MKMQVELGSKDQKLWYQKIKEDFQEEGANFEKNESWRKKSICN